MNSLHPNENSTSNLSEKLAIISVIKRMEKDTLNASVEQKWAWPEGMATSKKLPKITILHKMAAIQFGE